MAQSATFGPGRNTFRIPSTATNIRIYVAGGQGGQGGGDQPQLPGGSKGAGRQGQFRLPNSFAGDLFEMFVGSGGGGGARGPGIGGSGGTNGTNLGTVSGGVPVFPGNNNGGVAGYGATGGQQRLAGDSGGGGGGAGATIVRNLDRGSEFTRNLIVAGGGGGGGGASYFNFSGPTVGSHNGGNAGGFSSVTDVSFSVNLSSPGEGGNAVFTNGGNNGVSSCNALAGGDGGGVGGGGGGYVEGVGGACAGNDQQGGAAPANRSSGGTGGESAYSGQAGMILESQSVWAPTATATEPASDLEKAGGDGFVYFTWDDVEITSFTANPNPQESNIGIPSYSTILSWTLSLPSNPTLTLTSSIGEQWDVTGSSSFTVTNLPQSEAGVNSPATRTYTLYVGNTSSDEFESVTVSVYNDNTPDNFYVPNLTDVEPIFVYTLIPRDVSTNGSVTGMDMNHFVTGGPGVEVSVDSGLTWSTGSLLNTSGGTAVIRARVTSEPFNPDFTGQTNISPTYSLTIGTLTRTFTISTRAPDVEETFNIPNYDDYVPNPDIDTIPDVDPAPENQSNFYIVSNTLGVDDIEIEVPIRTDNPDVQVRIKKNGASLFGAWQDITEIGT